MAIHWGKLLSSILLFQHVLGASAAGEVRDAAQAVTPKKALLILGGGSGQEQISAMGVAASKYRAAGWAVEYLTNPTKAQVQARMTTPDANLRAVWFVGHGNLDDSGQPFIRVYGCGLFCSENITFTEIGSWMLWLTPGQLEEVILHTCYVGREQGFLAHTFKVSEQRVHSHTFWTHFAVCAWWEILKHHPAPVPANQAEAWLAQWRAMPVPASVTVRVDSCLGIECANGTCATFPPAAEPYVDQALSELNQGLSELESGDDAAARGQLEMAYASLQTAASLGADLGEFYQQVEELLVGVPAPTELTNDLSDKPALGSQDTVWITDWTFDSGGNCANQGWSNGGSGEWARTFQHITDNDKCNENTTCAWLWTDPQKIAYLPNMSFGPGAAILSNWLDDTIVSPWVPLQSTPTANRTLLSFRVFPGNSFAQGRIALNWSIRSQLRLDNTDTSALGDSFDYVSAWEHTQQWSTLSSFSWITSSKDLSPHIPAEARSFQLEFRVMDWQYFGATPPQTLNTGPGPYIDRVRIGRQALAGPLISEGIDSRSQAQDAFATTQNGITPGEHFSPSNDRYGTCAFSSGADLGAMAPTSPNLITGDSITIEVQSVRAGGGGIATIKWYGAITSGPHAGKAPSPYTVGANGFFETNADSMRTASGAILANRYTRDLDDTYFRGGDVLEYFWAATDIGGGFSSMPTGMTALPTSVAQAKAQTGGLHKVHFLPAIVWDPTYVAAIQADQYGDIDPTPPQIAASNQRNCILYVNQFDSRRRSGPLNDTAFMHTLNDLGYRGSYDVYDVQGYGNVNNQIGGRASLAQLTGYRLVVQDTGRQVDFCMPDGSNAGMEKIDQAQFYRTWLANGAVSEAGIATLWVLGENLVSSKATNPLFTNECGISAVVDDQASSANPDVEGIANRTLSSGNAVTFTGDRFSLAGGCPSLRAYDSYTPGGSATATHRYRAGTATGGAAIVVNSNNAMKWNTIVMGFGWSDIRDRFNGPPGTPAQLLARKILDATLGSCVEAIDPTSTPIDDENAAPRVTALHPNVPNPFNPATTIRWDLASTEHVVIGIYDVSGRRMRTLVDRIVPAGRHSEVWPGLDERGRPVAAGVYLVRLQTATVSLTRKLVVVK